MTLRIWPGNPHPLGATWNGEGVNFALFSEHATAVELCLFDRADAAKESARIRLKERTNRSKNNQHKHRIGLQILQQDTPL